MAECLSTAFPPPILFFRRLKTAPLKRDATDTIISFLLCSRSHDVINTVQYAEKRLRFRLFRSFCPNVAEKFCLKVSDLKFQILEVFMTEKNSTEDPGGSRQLQENKMGIMPIPKLLFTMAVPAICSMTLQAVYNIVDSIFVAQISDRALTAVTLVFPIQMLVIAVGVGTGVGVNSLIAPQAGEKRNSTKPIPLPLTVSCWHS